jgi:hypothetical protein
LDDRIATGMLPERTVEHHSYGAFSAARKMANAAMS